MWKLQKVYRNGIKTCVPYYKKFDIYHYFVFITGLFPYTFVLFLNSLWPRTSLYTPQDGFLASGFGVTPRVFSLGSSSCTETSQTLVCPLPAWPCRYVDHRHGSPLLPPLHGHFLWKSYPTLVPPKYFPNNDSQCLVFCFRSSTHPLAIPSHFDAQLNLPLALYYLWHCLLPSSNHVSPRI